MCDLLNSAGRCSAMFDHTGSRARPRRVRRKRLYASWSASEVSACHQIMTSASARSPETSYVPRTVTSLAASCAKSSSTSSA